MASLEDFDTALVDSFWEDESQRETEDDLEELNADTIRQAVVSATDWTTETIVGQIDKGNIQLSPQFQRRDAWRPDRKSRFIESLVLGLPIPQIVLAESKQRRGAYIVLDGKQRLLSLCQFAARPGEGPYEQLRLIGLEIRRDLNGSTLVEMKSDLLLVDDVAAFENQSIRTVVIKNWPNETFLYHVFLRLNTNSVTLSPQELRQALHPGPFVQFADEESRANGALRDILGQKGPDFRMRDTELLIRYYAFRNFITAYRGNLKAFLDKTCENLNADWETRERAIHAQLTEFDEIHWAVREVFGADAYHKWTGDGFEGRFNRAVFDVMCFAFAGPERRLVLKDNPSIVVATFRSLCANDQEFLNSIETTTKSVQATATRYGKWAEALNGDLDLDLPVLHSSGDHLTFV